MNLLESMLMLRSTPARNELGLQQKPGILIFIRINGLNGFTDLCSSDSILKILSILSSVFLF